MLIKANSILFTTSNISLSLVISGGSGFISGGSGSTAGKIFGPRPSNSRRCGAKSFLTTGTNREDHILEDWRGRDLRSPLGTCNDPTCYAFIIEKIGQHLSKNLFVLHVKNMSENIFT